MWRETTNLLMTYIKGLRHFARFSISPHMPNYCTKCCSLGYKHTVCLLLVSQFHPSCFSWVRTLTSYLESWQWFVQAPCARSAPVRECLHTLWWFMKDFVNDHALWWVILLTHFPWFTQRAAGLMGSAEFWGTQSYTTCANKGNVPLSEGIGVRFSPYVRTYICWIGCKLSVSSCCRVKPPFFLKNDIHLL